MHPLIVRNNDWRLGLAGIPDISRINAEAGRLAGVLGTDRQRRQHQDGLVRRLANHPPPFQPDQGLAHAGIQEARTAADAEEVVRHIGLIGKHRLVQGRHFSQSLGDRSPRLAPDHRKVVVQRRLLVYFRCHLLALLFSASG